LEEVRIPNRATYSPVSLTDVIVAAPLVSRLLLGATLPGRVLQLAALGAYAGSVMKDWARRQSVRKIDFLREFGADVYRFEPMPEDARRQEVRILVERLNDGYVPGRIRRRELARLVDWHLTDYIAGITGQRVRTSTQVRGFMLAQLFFPFAVGACDVLSGDIALFRDTGVFEPHVIAHEFCHRKGYLKELEAQALAYLALAASGEPLLVQSALCERLHRDLRVLAGDDARRFQVLVERSGLRRELARAFLAFRPEPGTLLGPVASFMRSAYDARMRLTGQNGLSDYDFGFTSFLYTFERSTTARQAPPPAGTVWARS